MSVLITSPKAPSFERTERLCLLHSLEFNYVFHQASSGTDSGHTRSGGVLSWNYCVAGSDFAVELVGRKSIIYYTFLCEAMLPRCCSFVYRSKVGRCKNGGCAIIRDGLAATAPRLGGDFPVGFSFSIVPHVICVSNN